MKTIRRLMFDLETSPNVVLSWRVGRKLTIDQDNIIKERAIICIGWKWEGERRTHILTWDNKQNDFTMLREFMQVLNEADEIIAHNGDKFDMPWFRARCAFHGLRFRPDYKTVDTLKWARRGFLFNSNRLDYLARFLGVGQKIKTEFGLWKDICLHNCPKAMRRMTDYCQRDVEVLEKVWARLAALVPAKTHAGVHAGLDKWTCPKDGSQNVKTAKTRVTAAGTKLYQMQCLDCGGFFTISEAAHTRYLEVKNNQLKQPCKTNTGRNTRSAPTP